MKILVTGGAGYIGSHTLRQFLGIKHEVCILGNLSKGSKITPEDLRSIRELNFFEQDLDNFKGVKDLSKGGKFDAMVHSAANIEIFESIQDPLKYYMNSTANTSSLIQTCLENSVSKFIFSSTVATYGEPKSPVMGETSPLEPTSPYGRSELVGEEVLRDTSKVKPESKHCILCYFNVADAYTDFKLGQRYLKVALLVKVAAEVITRKREKLHISGDDHETRDGICIRNSTHVDDTSSVHSIAFEYLETNESNIFNVGYGRDFSVKEVIEAMKEVSGVDFEAELAPRRAGDPSVLISSAEEIHEFTSWKPKYDDLKLIRESLYGWEKQC